MTIEKIMQELQHYTNEDLMEKSIYQLLEMYFTLLGDLEKNQEAEEEND